jgi:parallel beta-helix repeat protein
VTDTTNDVGILIERSNNNVLTGNIAKANYGDGIKLYLSNSNTLTSNIVTTNKINGIELQSSNTNVIQQNKVNNNTNYGIYLQSSSNLNTITNNDLTLNGIGSRSWDATSTNNNFSGNNPTP